ncbi:ANTAR domain-containing response regulator [Vagococcus carniphilus]|uniref:ANTAR domain-containing response regulator n=1 Tax=Vagococcus carniphilus TaxID=218144 RepID=UPI003B5A02AE
MGRRVVVVDDESLTRMNFVEFLEDQGYEVVGQACNGIEAVKICDETLPDVVLMDIEMPKMNGLDAAEQIIANKSVKGGIIFLSAYSNKVHIKRASRLGAGGYLVKPLDEKSLIPTIECVIAKGRENIGLSEEINRLEVTLEDRKVIERAKGLLMEKNNISEAIAYKTLREISMKRRVSLREIADILVSANDG